MCGRYQVTREFSEIKVAFGVRSSGPGSELDLSGNIAASYGEGSRAPLIAMAGGERTISSGRFWYVPPLWHKPLKSLPTSFNARAERVLSSRFWRDTAENRRCLVPAVAWFERDSSKLHDYQFSPTDSQHRAPDSALFAFAGLWADSESEDGAPIRSFAIMTREASADAAPIHPRMPLIVPPNLYDAWLVHPHAKEVLATTLEESREIPLTIALRTSKTVRKKDDPDSQLTLFGRSS